MFRSMRRVSFVLLTILMLSLVFVLPASAASPGDLDTTFNTTGKVTTDFGGTVDVGYALAIQPIDGKIVVAGYANPNGLADYDFALARYHGFSATGAPGTLDTVGFGTLGKVTTDFGSSSNDRIQSVAIQSDGMIVAAGWTDVNGHFDFAVARYDTSGNLDPGFNGTGMVVTNLGGDQFGNSVAIQADGKIVVGGYDTAGSTADFFLARYDSAGNLDTLFNSTGMVIVDLGGDDRIQSVAIQSGDQKIVVAGYSNQGGGSGGCQQVAGH